MSVGEEVMDELDFSWVIEWNELPDSLFISLHIVEREMGLLIPATNELQDCFFEERIRALVLAWVVYIE